VPGRVSVPAILVLVLETPLLPQKSQFLFDRLSQKLFVLHFMEPHHDEDCNTCKKRFTCRCCTHIAVKCTLA